MCSLGFSSLWFSMTLYFALYSWFACDSGCFYCSEVRASNEINMHAALIYAFPFLRYSTVLFLSLFSLQSQHVTPTPTSQVSSAKPAQYEVKIFILFSHLLHLFTLAHSFVWWKDYTPLYNFINPWHRHWMLVVVCFLLLWSTQISVLFC